MTVVISARGHAGVTATHAKTFEVAVGDDIGPRATCVVGVGASADWDALRALGAGPLELELRAGGAVDVVRARGNPFFSVTDGVVVRRTGFRGVDTVAIDADKGAADLDRSLVAALADPSARLTVSVRALGPAPSLVHVRSMALPLDPAVAAAGEVVADPGWPAALASAALVSPGAGQVVVVGSLPKGSTALRVALAGAASVPGRVAVWSGAGRELDRVVAAVPAGRSVAVAVAKPGEAVASVAVGVPERVGVDDSVAVAVAPPEAGHDPLRPLFVALLAEGVSPRALARAVESVPELAGSWSYNDFVGLAP